MAFQQLLDLQESLRNLPSVAAIWLNNRYLDRVTLVDENGVAKQLRLKGKNVTEVTGRMTYRRSKEDGGYPVSQTVFTDEVGDETIVDSRRI